ncbi:MAG: adenosine deaminase [Oceanospirillaceae bacterium]|nr:adenosine deaminase [Oceanospirillaceae bacterium]MBT4443417.1 adenosine deaminase [Oceanospirillaceae bacterium]MBT6078652.1 adenosine deaminase [Oceanospirillaceae bacterium]MBT7330973.1 adenosine deaminase [Oceanospirillaceae bacterium]
MQQDLQTQIQQLPKVELHSHLEGCIQPDLVRTIAQRNGISLKQDLFTADDMFAWSDFVGFLNAYDEASFCLRKPQDYRDIMYTYMQQCAEEGTIYAETFISPDHAAAVGMSYDEMLSGCVQGIDDAQRDFGIVGRLIISCVRHLGPEQALIVAQQLVDNPHPYIVGFGMGGNESMFTQADFAPAFNVAAAAGYACTTHAGEVLGPESVWDAIDNLPVTRIGHGVRSVEDPALMAELVKRGIALEVCPGSNIALSVYPDLASHPLNKILEAGISTSLNSDDPPFFATTVGSEYQSAAQDFGLDLQQLRHISHIAMQASFADADTKARLLAVIG